MKMAMTWKAIPIHVAGDDYARVQVTDFPYPAAKHGDMIAMRALVDGTERLLFGTLTSDGMIYLEGLYGLRSPISRNGLRGPRGRRECGRDAGTALSLKEGWVPGDEIFVDLSTVGVVDFSTRLNARELKLVK